MQDRRRRGAVTLLAACALFGGACGGDDPTVTGTGAPTGEAGTAPGTGAATATGMDHGTEAAAATGTIAASDQAGDGASIVVDSASIHGSDGFIAVHIDEGGAPGAVIGHAPVAEGDNADVLVTFDTPLSETTTVWPMLHIDAGTPGEYEFPNGADVPVTDENGPVMLPIEVTVGG